jgi:hypothetical protein
MELAERLLFEAGLPNFNPDQSNLDRWISETITKNGNLWEEAWRAMGHLLRPSSCESVSEPVRRLIHPKAACRGHTERPADKKSP